MSQLIWNDVGERYFETGVDRGVLYPSDGIGVVWNGLVSVKESPSGGDSIPYYIDGIKYLNVATRKEFSGTIEAYTYPDEFSEYDGWSVLDNGIAVDEQRRTSFNLSYRTLLGNDVDGPDHGYKIHLIYNALATPTESAYSSISENAEALTFSWSFTTTAIKSTSDLSPLSHVVVDSTKTNPTQLSFIEQYLYGTTTQPPSFPSLDLILSLFANPLVTMIIQQNTVTGISPMLESKTLDGDLRGRTNDGLYLLTPSSKLAQTATPGLYRLV